MKIKLLISNTLFFLLAFSGFYYSVANENAPKEKKILLSDTILTYEEILKMSKTDQIQYMKYLIEVTYLLEMKQWRLHPNLEIEYLNKDKTGNKIGNKNNAFPQAIPLVFLNQFIEQAKAEAALVVAQTTVSTRKPIDYEKYVENKKNANDQRVKTDQEIERAVTENQFLSCENITSAWWADGKCEFFFNMEAEEKRNKLNEHKADKEKLKAKNKAISDVNIDEKNGKCLLGGNFGIYSVKDKQNKCKIAKEEKIYCDDQNKLTSKVNKKIACNRFGLVSEDDSEFNKFCIDLSSEKNKQSITTQCAHLLKDYIDKKINKIQNIQNNQNQIDEFLLELKKALGQIDKIKKYCEDSNIQFNKDKPSCDSMEILYKKIVDKYKIVRKRFPDPQANRNDENPNYRHWNVNK